MGPPRKQVPQAPAGARRQCAADRAMRAPTRSPGRPEPSRAVQREFWRLIGSGIGDHLAGRPPFHHGAGRRVGRRVGAGRDSMVSTRWRDDSLSLDEPSGQYLSFAECEEIALLRAQD